MAFSVRAARTMALFLWLCAGAALAQDHPALEQQLKAAYLYKFAGFVEWPGGALAHPGDILQIGVAGDDVLAAQLTQMVAGRSVGGHALAVRKVRPGESLAGLHILFVGAQDRAAMAELLGAARGLPLLTVSDSDAAAALGSMINFMVERERLRFAVALGQVAPSRLRISARMLAVASNVSGSAP
jgi:hypothetical protein